METILPSQPESNKQLLKRSLLLYRKGYIKVFIPALLLSLTVFIPRFISTMIGHDLFLNTPIFSSQRLWILIINFSSILFFVAILWHMNCVSHHHREPLKEDFLVGVKKMFYVFIATLIQSTIVFAIALVLLGLQIFLNKYNLISFTGNLLPVLLTCFLFLGQFLLLLYLATLFYFITPIIAIENKGIFTALEKSVLLVWNHWWRTLTMQITPWIVYILFLVLIKLTIASDIHIYFTESGRSSYWSTLINLILFTLFNPWVAATLLIQLKDLELRNKLSGKVSLHEKKSRKGA